MAPIEPQRLFQSFWLGGYECACHINGAGVRLDLLDATQHDAQVYEDYMLLKSVGIETVRDGIRWPMIEQPDGSFDFSSFLPMFEAGQKAGVQVIWDICHYGWPSGLDIFSPEFVTRFARFSKAVAEFVRARSDAVPYYSPVNEISFFCWAAGEVGWFHPYHKDRGAELKRQLVRAAIACCKAVLEVDPRARFVHVDPIINIVPPRERPEEAQESLDYTNSQYEAWDMIGGLREPELGGQRRFLDIVGVNFYHSNQWEHHGERLRWEDEPRDDRWLPLHLMIKRVYDRYQCPIFIGETSHFGSGRARWIREIGEEIKQCCAAGVPLAGVCIYPIIDRPDWENANHWHNSGLWDLPRDANGLLRRELNQEYADALADAQAITRDSTCRGAT